MIDPRTGRHDSVTEGRIAEAREHHNNVDNRRKVALVNGLFSEYFWNYEFRKANTSERLKECKAKIEHHQRANIALKSKLSPADIAWAERFSQDRILEHAINNRDLTIVS